MIGLAELSIDLTFLIADKLEPKDWISMMISVRGFGDLLQARLHRLALTYKCRGGRSVLSWAAINRRESIFRTLLRNGASGLPSDQDGNTVLHHLAIQGDSSNLVGSLHECKVDVNARNIDGETALIRAICLGHENVVRTLLEAGADPAKSNTRCRRFRKKISLQGAASQTVKKPLHYAAEKGHDKIVQLLIDAGVDVSCTTVDGWSALHFAARKGHDKVVQLLIGADIDVSCTTLERQSGLHCAAAQGHLVVYEQLLKAGIDPSLKDVVQKTADYYLNPIIWEINRVLARLHEN